MREAACLPLAFMTAMVLSGEVIARFAGRNVKELFLDVSGEASEYDDLECLCLLSSWAWLMLLAILISLGAGAGLMTRSGCSSTVMVYTNTCRIMEFFSGIILARTGLMPSYELGIEVYGVRDSSCDGGWCGKGVPVAMRPVNNGGGSVVLSCRERQSECSVSENG